MAAGGANCSRSNAITLPRKCLTRVFRYVSGRCRIRASTAAVTLDGYFAKSAIFLIAFPGIYAELRLGVREKNKGKNSMEERDMAFNASRYQLCIKAKLHSAS